MALMQSYKDILHVFVHLTPSGYELQGRHHSYFSASSKPNTESLKGEYTIE